LGGAYGEGDGWECVPAAVGDRRLGRVHPGDATGGSRGGG
jgi:hypothetical protein